MPHWFYTAEDWLDAAGFVCRRIARHGFVDLPYTPDEVQEIETAGKKAALNLVETAVNEKMAGLGLNCPIERIEQYQSYEIAFKAGNLGNSATASVDDVKIVLKKVGGGIDHLKVTLDRSHDTARLAQRSLINRIVEALENSDRPNFPVYEDYLPTEDIPLLVRFKVTRPEKPLDRNSPLKFMEFFEGLKLGKLREFTSKEDIDTAIQADDKSWIGFFRQIDSLESYIQKDGGYVFCDAGEFLKVLDIDSDRIAELVTIARIEKARQFGPVRHALRRSLESHLEY